MELASLLLLPAPPSAAACWHWGCIRVLEQERTSTPTLRGRHEADRLQPVQLLRRHGEAAAGACCCCCCGYLQHARCLGLLLGLQQQTGRQSRRESKGRGPSEHNIVLPARVGCEADRGTYAMLLNEKAAQQVRNGGHCSHESSSPEPLHYAAAPARTPMPRNTVNVPNALAVCAMALRMVSREEQKNRDEVPPRHAMTPAETTKRSNHSNWEPRNHASTFSHAWLNPRVHWSLLAKYTLSLLARALFESHLSIYILWDPQHLHTWTTEVPQKQQLSSLSSSILPSLA
jgi:hypothetical protein